MSDVEAAHRHLVAGDPDAALAALAGDASVEGALLRARALRDRGALDEVVEAVEAAIAGSDDPARTVPRAARLLFNGSVAHLPAAKRRPHAWFDLRAADAMATRALAVADDRPATWVTQAEVWDDLGRSRRALEAYEAAVAVAPDDVGLRLRVARTRFGRGDVDGARVHLDQGLALAPEDPQLLALLRTVAVALGDADAARGPILAATDDLDAAVADLVAVGLPDEAEALVVGLDTPAAHAHAARFALWRGDDASAAGHLAAAEAGHPAARLTAAALAVRAGVDARSVLDAALVAARGPGGVGEDEVWAWRAEARRAAGDRDGALRDASQAVFHGARHHLVGHLLRQLCAFDPRGDDRPVDPWAWKPVATRVADLMPEAAWSGRQGDVRAGLEAVLVAMGGNRSCTPTVVRDGRLVALSVPPHPRHEARTLQHALRHDSIEGTFRRYDALQAAFPDAHTVRTYRGETLLWLLRLDEATASFDDAIARDPTTVWAWIGKGAAAMFGGQPDAALGIWDEGVRRCRYEGPTLFPYRAEARWMMGDREGALADVEVGIDNKPRRPWAWVLRVLLGGQRAPAARVGAWVRTEAPGLWLDAADAAGVDPGDLGRAPAVLHQALRLVGGNRSSELATWRVEGDPEVRLTIWPERPMTRAFVFGQG